MRPFGNLTDESTGNLSSESLDVGLDFSSGQKPDLLVFHAIVNVVGSRQNNCVAAFSNLNSEVCSRFVLGYRSRRALTAEPMEARDFGPH